MKFYLMRHGEAEFNAPSDAQRKLTDRGVELLKYRLASSKAMFEGVNCIVHSPYRRTTETAEIASEVLDIDTLYCSDLWTPESDPHVALNALEHYVDAVPLIVTHMPIVSYVEALCCDGNAQYPQLFGCGETSSIEADWPGIGLGMRLARF